MGQFTHKSELPFPVKVVFDWHTRPGAFERLNPPWRPVRILKRSKGIQSGAEVVIKLPVFGPLGIKWHLRHTQYQQNALFEDTQVTGPFKSWTHRHIFESGGVNQSVMLDQISYQLPLVMKLGSGIMQKELTRLFKFRHAVLAADLKLHDRFKDKPRLKVLISGASGFIGSALVAFLESGGHSVTKLVRHPPRNDNERSWDPELGVLDPEVFKGIDAVINLCGENIAAKRWSESRRAALISSRVKPASLLATTIAGLTDPPKVAIMASGAGYYGDTGAKLVDESYPAGDDFLAQLAVAWEAAADPIRSTPCRLIQLRTSTVLNGDGGALGKLLPIFKMGLGGRLGSGRQLMSWIAMQDLLGIIQHALFTESLSGAINVAAPKPCTNIEFTKALGETLRRPTICGAPSWGLKLALGGMAEALLLSNCGVIPKALIESGYEFVYPDIRTCLKSTLF
jgi:uncharacterized protein (TIGR01777 family)